MAFREFISKLSLGSRLCSGLFIVGVLLKLTAAASFTSVYTNNFFRPFLEYFISSGFDNPYQQFASSSVEVFPYPVLMLLILSIPKLLFGWIGASLSVSILLIKIPLLFADIAIFYVLKSWLNHKNTLKLILLYWFSPVLIYISYIHGQLDAIPIALLFISLYFLFRSKLNYSAIFLACAMATKTVIIATLPMLLIFLFSQRLPSINILRFIALVIAVFILINSPYILSESFLSMVFNNQQQSKLLLSSINFGGPSIYLLPLAYSAVLLKGISLHTLNKDIFVMFLGFCFALLLIFTSPGPGWYFWLLPFLFYFYSKSSSQDFFLVLLLQAAFLLYFALLPNEDFYMHQTGLMALPYLSLQEFFNIGTQTSDRLIINLSFTFLQLLLIFNCYLLYSHGLNRYSQHKITSIPFLIGIGGDSGSGKSLFSDSLVQIFSSNKSSQLHGDDLHKWERGNGNWSKHTHLDPKANRLHHELKILKDLLNGKTIYRKKYNHDNGSFDKLSAISAPNLLIYEGLHPFFLERQRNLFDLKFFLNPSSELNSAWKIARDTSSRGKSKEEVVKQIDKRSKDSESYIQTQLKFADIIIEPILDGKFDSQPPEHLSYRLTLSNSFGMDGIFEIFNDFPDLVLEHHFLDDGNQTIHIKGLIASEDLDLLAYKYIEGLQELGISKPIWPSNAFGALIFIATHMIFDEAEYARSD